MAITKKFLKTKAVYKVKFSVSAEEAAGAESVSLCGGFNAWDTSSHPMRRMKSGDFMLELEFPAGATVPFRYLTGHGVWLNEQEADESEHCPFAQANNSILKL
jgi:1,4-alpha-glucan branching enzyme